jgi:hypothetical protein
LASDCKVTLKYGGADFDLRQNQLLGMSSGNASSFLVNTIIQAKRLLASLKHAMEASIMLGVLQALPLIL